MKRKYANRPDWKRVTRREYKQIKVYDHEYHGYISLLVIKEVVEPLYVTVGNMEHVCIADQGYMWLQYSPMTKHHSLTAMFDRNGQIIQWYFDIVKGYSVSEEGIPYFVDLFLDVVVTPNRECFLLDEDELQEALNQRRINEEEFKTAKREAELLIKSIQGNHNELIHRSFEDLMLLKGERDHDV
jgi:predicted RNA-binding protein associated with RNAse of E/G family